VICEVGKGYLALRSYEYLIYIWKTEILINIILTSILQNSFLGFLQINPTNMLVPFATGILLGAMIMLAISYYYFKYKIYDPYRKSVKGYVDITQGNIKKRDSIIRKQDKLIDEMQKYVDKKEDLRNRLSDN